MNEKTEITFMQVRLIRLASEKWHLPIDKIVEIFKKANVLKYIEDCYGIFSCEGDRAVLIDVTEYVKIKGVEIT